MTLLDSLPTRPLRPVELEALREADGVTEAAPLGVAADAIRALAVQAGDTIHGLAHDPDEGWVVVESREAGDPEDLAAVRDALKRREATRVDDGDTAGDDRDTAGDSTDDDRDTTGDAAGDGIGTDGGGGTGGSGNVR
ncbi:hypothetical protein BRC97_10505 [Halobacteriales archaeon QS_6_71_20]|nr:MAG: hypothetical protein BRC97_10505 [Halobacteriales archaeon QS_6_71_20]